MKPFLCRKSITDVGLGTKILPEAISWHFAGKWDHMAELSSFYDNKLSNSFPISLGILSRSVSIPISVKMPSDFPKKIKKAIAKVLG